jgi:hypothetical protein
MDIENISSNYVPSLPPEIINNPPSSPVDTSNEELPPVNNNQTQVDILA